MSVNYGQSLPGFRTAREYSPRPILAEATSGKYLPLGKVLDSTASRDADNTGDTVTIRPGVILGKITSSGKYAPSFYGLTSQSTASNATTITTSTAVATEVSRRVGATGVITLRGAPTTAGTVAAVTRTLSAINTATGVLTITATPGAVFVSGSLIGASDGSETPKCVLDEYLRVTDVDGNAIDAQLSRMLIGGIVDETQLIPYVGTTNSTLLAAIESDLNQPSTGPGTFTFIGNF